MTKYYKLTEMLAKTLFKKDSPIIPDNAVSPVSEAGLLLYTIRRLVSENKINDAENILFENIDKSKPIFAAIGIEFYARISRLSEEELIASDFSVEEIGEGLADFLRKFGIKLVPKSSQDK